MTFRHALHILASAAATYAGGAGRGIRPIPGATEKADIRAAIEKIWPKMYGRPATRQDLRNMGLRT